MMQRDSLNKSQIFFQNRESFLVWLEEVDLDACPVYDKQMYTSTDPDGILLAKVLQYRTIGRTCTV